MSIRLSCLGSLGRFGNQLFQYVFGLAYARALGVPLEIPSYWVGRRIFKSAEALPGIGPDLLPCCPFDAPPWPPQNSLDLTGHFQTRLFFEATSHQFARQALELRDDLPWPEHKPRAPYAAVHLRHGDFLANPSVAAIAPIAYIKALKQLHYDREILFFSEDAPRVNYLYPPEAQWLNDFLLISQAELILRANSTFSWWAAALADPSTVIYSPLVGCDTGWVTDVGFTAGNWPAIAPGGAKLSWTWT